jgi:hypothetical protein
MKVRLLVVTMILAVTVAACGKKEDIATPVATPTVTFNHTRVPLGSPVEVTYRFQVAPSAAISGNYRVMVHFLDADDELMWTDDHNPPVPTSTWKPGQIVEYTRTVFVPFYPYVGDAVVSIGLYAPDSAQRLPLAGEAAGQRSYRVARLRLQPQTDNIFLAYVEGWNGPETAPDNQIIEWQWTKKDAGIRFRNPKRNATFYLHYDGQPAMFDAPQTVNIYLRDAVVDTFQVTGTDEMIRRVALTAAQFGEDEMVTLRIALDKTFVPALAKTGSKDVRELGIRVFHAFVEAQ